MVKTSAWKMHPSLLGSHLNSCFARKTKAIRHPAIAVQMVNLVNMEKDQPNLVHRFKHPKGLRALRPCQRLSSYVTNLRNDTRSKTSTMFPMLWRWISALRNESIRILLYCPCLSIAKSLMICMMMARSGVEPSIPWHSISDMEILVQGLRHHFSVMVSFLY